MLAYEPGDSLAHSLDPRSKLAVQFAFAAAAFAHTTPRGLAALTILVVVLGWLADADPRLVAEFRWLAPFLLAAPLLGALRFGPPWVAPAGAVRPALASYRVLLVVLVGALYVRTTPVRDTRAAIQRTVPGRPGQFLGLGTAFVMRLLPVLRRDLATARDAVRARLGDRRPLHERFRLVAVAGLARAFDRADRFALALRTRCFAWNPTLPPLRFRRRDWLTLLAAAALAGWAAFPLAATVAAPR